ncbi:MAG TPA: HEAT repeat domain-containing protein [Vicinamibacterales bacterium]|nr:HEAT repeat domain-containing protein [Vicinamibacterales bacterium]
MRRPCLVASLLAIPAALNVSGQQAAGIPTVPKEVRLTAEEATRLANEAQQSVAVELAPGLEARLWAPEQLVIDPIALDLDPQGALYVTSSTRNSMPLDIREHPTWVPPVHSLKTVEDLRQFYLRELSPERSATNTWLPDLNGDGSRDYRDLREMKERIYRIRDTDGDGLADFSQVMIEGFNDDPTYDVAGGLLYHEGDLIFGMAPGVWRLRDENGDGTIDSQTTISEGYSIHPAFGGHGISGVTRGPDGRIYWEVGDIGLDVTDRGGRRWSYANQGAVLRANPDGTGFEVFATGIRNLQEFAFDEYGNLLSVDNDGDHQGETERVVYITEGSDAGWRANWQYGKYTDPLNNRYNVWMAEEMFKPRHEGQAAHIVPPIAPFPGGPAGVVYDTGTTLSDEWRKTLLVASFPGAASNARIHALRFRPDGAGFALDQERVFLRGILTVGMKFGPDGALYLADWITGWDSKNKGRIWKVDAPAAAKSAARVEVRTLLQEDFAARSAADLSGLLRHADQRIRLKAQFDLARRGDSQTLLAAARAADHQLSRVHGLWGLGQLARADRSHARHLTPFLQDADPEIRAQAAKLIGDLRHAEAADALVAVLKDASTRARFFAAEALGRLAHKPAVPAIVAMLAGNDDRDVYLRHAGSLALSRIGDAAALAALSTHSSRGVRIAAIVALRRLGHAEVARFLSDADERIVTEAARAINDDGGIDGALPALARIVSETRFTNEPLIRRAISASLRSGTLEDVDRLAAFAADRSRTAGLRAEAIATLGVWASPSTMDRVDGAYLGQPAARDAAAARDAVARLFASLPPGGEADPLVRSSMAEAAGRLGVAAAAPTLLAQLRSDASADVRLAAFRALEALRPANMAEVLTVAFADADPAVRRAALGVLPSLPLTDAARVQHLQTVMEHGAIQDRQAALEVLGTLKSAGAAKLLESYLDDLSQGTVAPELQLDVVTAVETSGLRPLQSRLEALMKSRKAETVAEAFPQALLQGGSRQRGRQVFTQHPAAECTRCHTVGGRGTDVGPNLTNVGSTLTREQILESMLQPNARIAPGFGTVTVALAGGEKVIGTLKEETPTHLVLTVGTPPAEQRIAKADVRERADPTSAMPPMGLILQPGEIRDLVEFLSSLK